MEIERKWLVSGWPEDTLSLPMTEEYHMEQGYISTYPTVRLRKEALVGGETAHVLCFKSGGGLSRQEIELDLDPTVFAELAEKIMGKPMVPKTRRSYALPDGCILEVNEVDKGQPTAFFYAEIEFDTEEQALAWQANDTALAQYLAHEVTNEKGQSMASYWCSTRGEEQ